MKKIVCQGRNHIGCFISNTKFALFSGIIFIGLFILASVAIKYGQICISKNGKKSCYMISNDLD